MSSNSVCSCGSELSIDPPWSAAHCFVAITGASRGFGRALCVQLTKALSAPPNQAASINFLLMARNLDALKETMNHITMAKCKDSTSKINVLISHPGLDMSEATESNLRDAIKPLVDLSSAPEFRATKQWNLLIHNAADVGLVERRADDRTLVPYMQSYYHANVIAAIVLTSVFLSHFAPIGSSHPPVTVVNISSLAADKPLSYMTDYCVTKAARQMYFRCVALDRPTVAVFNYSPGPLSTDMYADLANRIGHKPSRDEAQTNINMKKLIEPEESARVCVAWLRRRHSSLADGVTELPQVLACPVHQREYADLWLGTRLDYYDAATWVR